jgi:NAD-dependent dihydropyrimidine dehydrogenase PreA subunit
MITTMQPHISETLCEKCGECVDTCPYEVFSDENGRPVVATPEDCVECAACVETCPHGAISMGD